MSLKEPLSFRIKIFVLKNSLYLLILFVLFSPLIVWHIAHFNLFLLQTFAIRQSTIPASTFVTSTMVGLITLFGVALTILWNYYMRQRELATKRVYVVDVLLDEISINNNIAKKYLEENIKCSDVGLEPLFRLVKWNKLEDMATLLPRDLYTLLSNLYGRLEEKPIYKSDLGQVISMMESIIEKLYKYRKELRTLYEVRMSKEDRKAKKELLKSDKKAQKRKN
jgi:hypothetical protein